MRQVRRKRAPRTASVRSSGRLKSVRGRDTGTRSGRRGSRGKEAPAGLLGVFGSGFIPRHPMLSLTVGLLMLAGAAGLVAGGHVSGTASAAGASFDRAFASAGLAVNRITLTGQSRTGPDEIYAAAGVRQGQSIMAVHPAEIRLRLMKLPWVADAAVKRVFPDTVAITLIEKLPFALWKHDGEVGVVERSGAMITQADPAEFMHLPMLIGDGAPNAAAALLDAVGATRAVAARLKIAERVSGRRWNLILDGPVAVKLPEIGWERELGTLEKMIVEQGVLERDIEIIDLRFADRYIFRLRNGDSHESPRERPT